MPGAGTRTAAANGAGDGTGAEVGDRTETGARVEVGDRTGAGTGVGTGVAGRAGVRTGSAAAAGTIARGLAAGLWGRAEQQDFRSRVRGTLLGAALGDALGAPVADLSLDAIREAHGPQGLTGPAPAYGRPGRVTAATQLTLFTADGLIRAHVRRDTGAWHPPTDIHRAYLRWATTQHDWGPDERRKDNGWLGVQEWLYARRGPDRASTTGFADDVLGTLDQPKNPTARNAAAATRSAPFGLLVGWEPALVLQLATECAAQSHGHPGAYLTAGAFAVIVHGLTRGDSLDAAIQRALGLLGSRPGHQGVTDALQRALAAVPQGMPSPTPSRPSPPARTAPRAATPRTSWPSPSTARSSPKTSRTACASPSTTAATPPPPAPCAAHCSAPCTVRPPCRAGGSPTSKAAPPCSNSPTTSPSK